MPQIKISNLQQIFQVNNNDLLLIESLDGENYYTFAISVENLFNYSLNNAEIVTSINGYKGDVILTTDDIDDSNSLNKFISQEKLDLIEEIDTKTKEIESQLIDYAHLTDFKIGLEVGNLVTLVDVNGEVGLPAIDGSNLTGIEVTGTIIKDKLESLQGEDRLDASAIKNLPVPETPIVEITEVHNIDFTVNQNYLTVYNLVKTNANPIICNLPEAPLNFSRVIFVDGDGKDPTSPTGFGKNSLTIFAATNQNIQGYDSIILDVENSSLELVFEESTLRWTAI